MNFHLKYGLGVGITAQEGELIPEEALNHLAYLI